MRSIKRHWPTVLVLIVFLSSFSSAQNTTPDVRQLEQGKPTERELAGGAVHAYSIQLTAGQFVSVIVDQRGIDVVVSVFAPDGKLLITQGAELLSFIADASGSYRLEVSLFEPLATPGRYEVKLDALRTAKPEERDQCKV